MSDKKIFVFVVAYFDRSDKLHTDGFYCCVDDTVIFNMIEYDGKPAVTFQIKDSQARFVTHNIEPFDAMLRGKWQDWTEWAEVHVENIKN